MAIINSDLKPILLISFKEYIVNIELSKSQRPKYFTLNSKGTIKAGSKPVWKKLLATEHKQRKLIKPEHLKLPYCVGRFKGDKLIGVYAIIDLVDNGVDVRQPSNSYMEINSDLSSTDRKKKSKNVIFNIQTGEKIVANPTQAGTPKLHNIKGQDFYVGLNEFVRVKVVDSLKDYYYETKFKAVSEEKQAQLYDLLNSSAPLILHLEIKDTLNTSYNDETIRGKIWDVGNKGLPYIKTFSDFITNGYKDFSKILEDDCKLHICSEVVEYTPITEEKDREIIFTLYESAKKRSEYSKTINSNEQRKKINRIK